jgi:hypothetical protein
MWKTLPFEKSATMLFSPYQHSRAAFANGLQSSGFVWVFIGFRKSAAFSWTLLAKLLELLTNSKTISTTNSTYYIYLANKYYKNQQLTFLNGWYFPDKRVVLSRWMGGTFPIDGWYFPEK